jgi:hypothetical protein
MLCPVVNESKYFILKFNVQRRAPKYCLKTLQMILLQVHALDNGSFHWQRTRLNNQEKIYVSLIHSMRSSKYRKEICSSIELPSLL